MRYQLSIDMRSMLRTIWGKLKESFFIDSLQALLLFGAKKLFFVWILFAHEAGLYLQKIVSLIA